jgi:hypothetical protein
MRAAARSTSSCVAAALAAGLAGCTSDTSLALEAARAACAATLQALYDPISIDQPVSIPRVANTSADGQKFEFIWRHDQISGLSWRMLPREMEPAGDVSPQQSTTETQVRRYALVPSGEASYACRGSLAVRSIHGIWLRRTGSTQVTETKLTRHPVSF